jgi:protocatechuate 3,4-dioxygenase beta subunit
MRELTEENINEAVLKSIANTNNPRLKELFTCLIKHLHEFVKEVELSSEEWAAAMDFLYRAGKISTPKRKEFILLSDTLGVSSLVDLINGRGPAGATETSVLGPFYVGGSKMLEVGGDLKDDNEGEAVVVSGRVTTPAGKPIPGALLDIWQTAGNGLYENEDPEQPDGNLRCRMLTDAEGRYRFTTIKPVSYKVPEDGPGGDMLLAMGRHAWRPAHIHFIVTAEGYRPLTTELYVDDDKYIEGDAVFGVRESLAVSFKRNDSPKEAAKYKVKAPFSMVEYDFGLRPVD